jgi:hypothetical protein
MLDPKDPNLVPPVILFLLPCYGGNITEACFYSFLKFARFAEDNGIEYSVATHTHSSLISLGRSIMFSQSVQMQDDWSEDWTHIMWVDADIQWEPKDLMNLLIEDKDIIGGYYPIKTYPIRPASSPKAVEGGEETDTLIETFYIATGFMLIKRHVCEKMMDHFYDELKFKYGRSPRPDLKYVDLFAPIIDAENDDLYLSEDYAFCKRAREIGFKTYMSKKVQLGHAMGSHIFSKENEKEMLKAYEDQGRITITE